MSDNEEYDPFQEDNEIDQSFARPRGLDTLDLGVAYPILRLFPQQSKFKDNNEYPMNTVVQYLENGLKFQTILPKKHNNKSEKWFTTMNKLAEKKMGPKLVVYGKPTMGFEYELLRHTQEPDLTKLQTVKNIMARSQTTPTKRILDETPPHTPTKQMRQE